MEIGAAVLCGGKSSRMGQEKAFLTLGGETFLERILKQLQGFDEILLSVNHTKTELLAQYPGVVDLYPNCGPMSGLHAALVSCRSDALLAVSCDMPFLHQDLVRLLCDSMRSDVDVVIPVSNDGRWHPLCAVYRKSLWPVFQENLEKGDYKLQNALKIMRVRNFYIPRNFENCLKNVNTPEEYRCCCNEWKAGGNVDAL